MTDHGSSAKGSRSSKKALLLGSAAKPREGAFKAQPLRLPAAPRAITKGSSLADLLADEAIACLAHNLKVVDPKFPATPFRQSARRGIDGLGILERGHHLAAALRQHLAGSYSDAIQVLMASLTPPLTATVDLGLSVFFYLPHVCFVANYGLDPEYNDGQDPFTVSMQAQYELTRRFSAEFSMRPFLIKWQERTLKQLVKWTEDSDPHVRRLCSEGTRPRLPWATRIPAFIKNPLPTIPILEALKDDPDLYVRRSVANHLGDIAKDHLDLVLDLGERWLRGASPERKWLLRHALRYPAKKGHQRACKLRLAAK